MILWEGRIIPYESPYKTAFKRFIYFVGIRAKNNKAVRKNNCIDLVFTP